MNPTLLNEKYLKSKKFRIAFAVFILTWQLGIIANILTCRFEEKKPGSLTADTHLIETTRLISSIAFLPQANEANKIIEGNSLNFFSNEIISNSEEDSNQHEYSCYEYTNDISGRKDPYLKKIIPRSPPQISYHQIV